MYVCMYISLSIYIYIYMFSLSLYIYIYMCISIYICTLSGPWKCWESFQIVSIGRTPARRKRNGNVDGNAMETLTETLKHIQCDPLLLAGSTGY